MEKDTKPRYPLAAAQDAANQVADYLAEACNQILIAGSIRREREYVHDIDIVLWPIYEATPSGQPDLFGSAPVIERPVYLYNLLASLGLDVDEMMERDKVRIITIPGGERQAGGLTIARIPVELYLCEPDGSNLYALYQMRTGSADFNQSLAVRAKRMGMVYRAGHGLYNDMGTRMDDGSEEGIFRVLGMPWIEPKLRNGPYQEALYPPSRPRLGLL